MGTSTQFTDITCTDLTATVASGQTTSGTVDLSGTQLAGIFVPSTFDGTTISFNALPSASGTAVAVQDGSGNAYSLTTTASRYVPIPNLAIFAGIRFLQIVCGTSQSTSDTVFTLATRPV